MGKRTRSPVSAAPRADIKAALSGSIKRSKASENFPQASATPWRGPVSYTHLRAHETSAHL
eukprot:1198014-Alexandrium_andersonii.AAC.1